MPLLQLITANSRERQILKLAFEQMSIEVVEAFPDHTSYIQALQFKPDIIIIEFPKFYQDHLNFCQNINNIKNNTTLILGYGIDFPNSEKNAIHKSGVSTYLTRPLKFSKILTLMEKHFTSVAPEKMVWKKAKNNPADLEYIDKIFDKNVLPTAKLSIFVERISNLMAFPFTVAQILRISNDPTSGAKDLAKIIEADPVIATTILKMSNTVFFTTRNGKRITTIKEAIVRIGFKETKHMAMAITVMKSLSTEADSLGFYRKEFWKHSLAVACLSERLSSKITGLDSGTHFLCGLLSGFGIILFDEFFPEVFHRLLKENSAKSGSFLLTEKEKIVVTHIDLVKKLFEKWQLPPIIVDGIYNSDKIDRFGEVADRHNLLPEQLTALVINSAMQLAKSASIGSECDFFVSPIPMDQINLINCKSFITADLFQLVKRDIKVYSDFLKMNDREHSQFNSLNLEKALIVSSSSDKLFNVEIWCMSHQIPFDRINIAEKSIENLSSRYKIIFYCTSKTPDKNHINLLSSYIKDGLMVVFSENGKDTDKNIHYLPHSLDFRLVEVILEGLISTSSNEA